MSQGQSWTIRSVLAWMAQDFTAAGIASPRLDAEVLVAHALGVDRVRLYMDLDRPLSPEELARLRSLVVRRRRREPVAYITGEREFYRRAFAVNPEVLIPRPDTETLVERALQLLPQDRPVHVLDLCTGSGAIAVTLAAERALARVDATDVSEGALAVARDNARRHGVEDRVRLLLGDLFAAVSGSQRYPLIVANAPYIAVQDLAALAPEISAHEPALALAAGVEGLDVLERLITSSREFLAEGGGLLLEVGAGQSRRVAALLRDAGFVQVCTHRDLGGVERVVEAS